MLFDPVAVFEVLILLTLANGTPVIAKATLGDRCATPLDMGARMPDGKPVLGPSKTIRGVVLAIAASTAGAAAMGLGWRLGMAAGAAAMAGDLISSFIKRRLAMPPSSKATGLDQIPEALLPALLAMPALGLTVAEVVAIVAIFLVCEIVLSRLLYHLRIRDRPY